MAKFTISFRGKRNSNGNVKVPVLQGHHVSLIGNEDITATVFTGGMGDNTHTKARLDNMIGAATGDYYWPGWTDERFTVTPIGNGFMADVSIELDTANMKRRAE